MVQLSPQDKGEDGSNKQPGIRGREDQREKEQTPMMAYLDVLSGWRVGFVQGGVRDGLEGPRGRR